MIIIFSYKLKHGLVFFKISVHLKSISAIFIVLLCCKITRIERE